MNKLLVSLALIPLFAYAVTGNKVWRVPSGGSLGAWGPVNLADGTNAVTGALPSKSNLPAVGQQISASSGLTTVSSAFVDVTGLTVTITTTGRPVFVGIQPDVSGIGAPGSYVGMNGGPAANNITYTIVQFVRGSTALNNFLLGYEFTDAAAQNYIIYMSPNLWMIDTPAAGTYTYKVQIKRSGASSQAASLQYVNMVAFEL